MFEFLMGFVPWVFWACVGFAIIAAASCYKLDENMGVIPTFFGKRRKPVICKTGYHVEENGDIVVGEVDLPWYQRIGGLRFIGLRGFYGLWQRSFAYTRFTENQDTQDVPKHKVSYFYLGTYIYGLLLNELENIEKIRMTAKLGFEGEAVNLIKQWVNNDAWFSAVVRLIKFEAGELFKLFDTDTLLKGKSEALGDLDFGQMLFDRMVAKGLIQKILEDYGVKIFNFKIVDMTAPPDALRGLAKKFDATKAAEKITIVLDTVLMVMAHQNGTTVDAERAEHKAGPKAYREKYGETYTAALSAAMMELGQQSLSVDAKGGGSDAATLGALVGGSRRGRRGRRRRGEDEDDDT